MGAEAHPGQKLGEATGLRTFQLALIVVAPSALGTSPQLPAFSAMRPKIGLAIGLGLFSPITSRATFTIAFDYTYDTTANGGSGMFTGSNSGNQTYMNSVGSYLSSLLSGTSMSAITPGGGNTWTTSTFKPGSPSTNLTFSNPSIAANTVVIYVGSATGTALGGALGQGSAGNIAAASGSANDAWNNLLDHRGNGNYYMPWGGSLTFNAGVTWYLDSDITTVESASMSGKNDFFSVAVHEILHVLGFGTLSPPTVSTTTSWATYTNTSTHAFTGPNSLSVAGGSSITLNSDNTHWTSSLSSYSYQDGTTAQEALMDPSLTQGTRKYPTTLDMAAMKDIGYTVTAIPEPANVALIGVSIIGAVAISRRFRRKEQPLAR